jgi:ribosomal protein S18 acetylase RimI-like enzyme
VPAHTLGPHVVGSRIVVRRIVRGETGPSGGPALTDLLGTCLAWGDGACVVQPDRGGEPVTIALADVVSGKPVPPRASTRLRVSAAEAQRRAMALWSDLETEPLGDWVLRRSAGSTNRRANSVLAAGPAGLPDSAAYDAVVDFYAGHGQRPIAAVLPDSPEDELFRSRGWGLESHDADTVFELAGVAAVQRRLPRGPLPDAHLEGDDRLVTATLLDGAATGVAAYDDDWVGFRSIEVDPAHRRRGLGVAVMAALLEWGAEQGATTAYLQVLGDNEPALALYERLGFVEHHRYRYLAAPVWDHR